MKRIAIVSKDKAACQLCRKHVKEYGFVYDAKKPDLVITYGGDGTLLHAERVYPGVPKLPLRASPTCKKCHDHEMTHALELLKNGTFHTSEHKKLEAKVGNDTLLGLNDIIIRNKGVEHAIRFDVFIDKKKVFEHLIGDGLVVATPFGSTAYYHSITKDTVENGLGLALNNVTVEQEPLLLAEDVKIEVRILRGPAELAADNLKYRRALREGERIRVKAAKKTSILHLG